MKKLKTILFILSIFLLFILNSCSNTGNIPDFELIPVQVDGLYQYINRDGEIIINPQFEEAELFHDGLARVKSEGKNQGYKYINKEGKYAFPGNYEYAGAFSEEVAWIVNEDSYPVLINKQGEILVSLPEARETRNFSEGLGGILIKSNDSQKWGFVNKEGEIVIAPQFESIGYFSEGLCSVTLDGKVGYINKEGKFTINAQFHGGDEFSGELATVVNEDYKWGLINERGKFIVNPQYDMIKIDGDLFQVDLDGKYGWINRDGEVVINPQFNEAYIFDGNALAPVKIGKKYGYIDKSGKIEINPQFDHALEFNGGLAPVRNGRKWGFIGLDGKYKINPQYSYLSWSNSFKSTKTELIISDFFDINSIINVLTFGEGLNSPKNQTIDEILKEYPESDFKSKIDDPRKLYNGRHIISNLTANDEYTNVEFSVHCKPYTTVRDGWYEKKIYKYDAPINKYEYRISFDYSSTGYGKIDKLVKNIEDHLLNNQQGFNRIDDLFENENCTIRLKQSRRELRVIITSKKKDSPKSESEVTESERVE